MFKSTRSSPTTYGAFACAITCILCLVATGCGNVVVIPDGPNLIWEAGPKIYSTGSVPATVSGLGISGVVDQLPVVAPATITVTRVITNTGNQTIPAGYEINETVELMQFTSIAGTAGFTPVSSIPPITDQTTLGTALAPGDSMPVSFTFTVPSCGMYRETLTADASGAVAETFETDNVVEDFFGIASTMAINITVVPRNFTTWHAPAGVAPGPPPWITAAPAFPVQTATFTITATAPGTTFHYNYRQAPTTGVLGAVAQLIGPPPMMAPGPAVAGPIVITHQITAASPHNVPSVDILTDIGWEHFLPKVTAITADGCAFRQNTAQVSVAHP